MSSGQIVLNRISLTNFKNFDQASFEFDQRINCLAGNNGVGKTNVMEAIHYLGYTKGYFNPNASQSIKHGTSFFMVDGDFQRDGHREQIQCSLKKGNKRKVIRNGKTYEKLADHFGLIPVVIISPSDVDLIREGSELRRKFMDMIISMSDQTYLSDLIDYNKTLAQRNALLKYFAANSTFNKDNLEIYDLQLSRLSDGIHEKRKDFAQAFQTLFYKWYDHMLDHDSTTEMEEVDISYDSQLNKADLKELLEASLQKDRMLQYTSQGIHKDDLKFSINGYPVKKFGSQGQQKTFLIALKLSQFEMMQARTGMKPILLLDDIFDKLDDARVEQLLQLVNAEDFGQIFITDTHGGRAEELIQRTGQSYKIFQL